jgi:1,4-alpha-glucan branching enzyme
MGNEIGQHVEWRLRAEAEWFLLAQERHSGLQRMVRDLNRLYRALPALHDLDFEPEGFRWIDCHDADQSVLSFVRRARNGSQVVVVLNFTPVVRRRYRIGVPCGGQYAEILNTDSTFYGGSNTGNAGGLTATAKPWMGFACSLELTLPPLGALILEPL